MSRLPQNLLVFTSQICYEYYWPGLRGSNSNGRAGHQGETMGQFALPAPCCCRTEHFTEREVDVLCQVAAGLTNDEVAASMSISGHTVAGYLRAMLNRSQARTRAELVARAYAAGVLVAHAWPPRWSGRRCLTMPEATTNGLGHATAVAT
jgi:DNA-binding CsgD family transcriptional regulator